MTDRRIISPIRPRDKEKSVSIEPFSWEWKGVHFVRVTPGLYEALAVNRQGPDFVRRYRRWSLRIGFMLIGPQVEVSAYFNFGRNEDRPEIKRNSRFFQAWCIANGRPPHLGQHMLPAMFEGKRFIVRVEDATISAERLRKADGSLSKERVLKSEGEIYSRVMEVVSLKHS